MEQISKKKMGANFFEKNILKKWCRKIRVNCKEKGPKK